MAVHAQKENSSTTVCNFASIFACANELMNGLVAINDQGLPSGVGLEFRPPGTADD